MRATILVLCVLILFMSKTNAQSGTGGTLTLQQSIETGIANNLEVRESSLNAERAGVIFAQSKGNLIPRLNAGILHGKSQGRSIDRTSNTYINQQQDIADINLNSDVTVFNGFRLLNSLKRDALAYDAAKLEFEQQKYDITLAIIIAYLQVLNSEDQLALSKTQLELSRTQVARLEVLNQQGAIPPAQLYDLKGTVANDELSILSNNGQLVASIRDLAALMNVPFDPNIKLERLTADQFSLQYEGTAESIYQVAMDQLALVKAADLRTKSASKDVQVARGALAPELYLAGSFFTNYSKTKGQQSIKYFDQLRNNYGTFIGVGLNIPIINNMRARNNVTLAKIDQKNAEIRKQTLYTALQQAIGEAYINMRAAAERYKVLQGQVEAFTLAFRAAEVRFNAGLGTSVDYLVAKNNVDRANLNLINARYEYAFRVKILDYYQNKPLW
ncbi:MAG TPA: TolC family protein [Chitinophagaceae bacterium]